MDDEKLERDAAKILFSTPSKPEEVVAPAPSQGPEILFVCPFCNETYYVSAELAGKKINCRNCREACRVDSIKAKKKQRSEAPFWFALGSALGLVVGIALSMFVVLVLKLLHVI